jgi:hypothetical protein
MNSPVSLSRELALFPFIEDLWENGWTVLLPGDDESRLLRIAQVLYIAEYQHPALAQIFIQFAARSEFGGKSGFL